MMEKILKSLCFLFLLFWIFLANVQAENTIIDWMGEHFPKNLPGEKLGEQASAYEITLKISAVVIDTIIYLSGTLAVIGVIVWGAKYIFSFGWDAKESAKNTIIWSLIGLVTVMLAYAIVHNVVRILKDVME